MKRRIMRVLFLSNVNRILFFSALLIGPVIFCIAQNTGNKKMGKIAILSFSGGSQDERDGIAELFSFTPQVMNNFVVIPRTTITNAISQEQQFQYASGMTDADTMARLGNQFGADFVMSGSITSLGPSNLLIVSIVKIDVIQQVAGDYLIYNSLDDLKDSTILKKMAENLVSMMSKDSQNTDKLAVLPVQFSSGANEQEGDALAQLLSIFLMRNEKYEVYPRTKTLEQVEKEYTTQLSGQTRDSEMVSMGHGVNPHYVLSIVSRRIGTGNVFNVSVIDLEGANQIAGHSEQYASLSDGINAMDFLAKELSGIKVSQREREKRFAFVESTAEAEKKAVIRAEDAQKRSVVIGNFLKNSGFNLAGWYGFSIKSSDKSNSSSSSNMLWFGGANVELRLSRYFGFQTGIWAIQRDAEDASLTLLQ